MRFMLWISARAQDRLEIAAGRHSQSANQGTERLDRHAAFVGEDEGHDVDRVAFGVFTRQRPWLVVAGGAGETRTRFDLGQILPGVSERQRSRDLPNPVGELETEAAQHGRLGGKPDVAVIEDARTSFRLHARVLDDHLATNSVAVGKTLTVADFALAAALPFATSAEIPLTEFRHIQAWYGRLEQLEAWRNPFPA